MPPIKDKQASSIVDSATKFRREETKRSPQAINLLHHLDFSNKIVGKTSFHVKKVFPTSFSIKTTLLFPQ